VEPPPDLEDRILEAEERARTGRPLRQRIGTMVSIIASYAMRPQVGMAAVLLLMVGSSLLLIRVKPGAPNSVQATERGVPESDKEAVTIVTARGEPPPALPRADSPTAARPGGRSRATELGARQPGPEINKAAREEEASRAGSAVNPALDAPAATPPHASTDESLGGLAGLPRAGAGRGPAEAAPRADALYGDDMAAGSEPRREECEITLPRYEAALARAASPLEANRARWGTAECYARLGQVSRARRAYTALLGASAYAERARRALLALPPSPEPVAGGAEAAPGDTPKNAAKATPPSERGSPKAEASSSP
jgi:hypothetical protein